MIGFLEFRKKLSLLLVILIMAMTSCSDKKFTAAPINAQQQAGHFDPIPDLPFEFEYPPEWGLVSINRTYEELGNVGLILVDPRTPTPDPSIRNLEVTSYGFIALWNYYPTTNLSADVDSMVSGRALTSRFELQNDYWITLSGYPARVVEYVVNPTLTGYDTQMFEKRVFVYAQENIFEIYFITPQNERGGEFEKGYERLMERLKIIP